MAYKSQPTVTRPANTTAYTAGDAVGTVFQFTGIPGGSSGSLDLLVIAAAMRVNTNAVPAGMGSFRLHLWSSQATGVADNAAFDIVTGDRATYLGYVTIPAPVDFGATIYSQYDGAPNKPIRLTGNGLWCQIETLGAYTPAANSEEYVPELTAISIRE